MFFYEYFLLNQNVVTFNSGIKEGGSASLLLFHNITTPETFHCNHCVLRFSGIHQLLRGKFKSFGSWPSDTILLS